MFIPELKKSPEHLSNYSEYFETADKIINICNKDDFIAINEDIWSLFKQTVYNIFSMPIKEYQIVDQFLGAKLKDEVMSIKPVQKQTSAGQRTRFKAYVAVGDNDGHLGLGHKCAKEVATAIRGAIIQAKMNVIPIRRGYWGKKAGAPHTVANKLMGKCGSVRVRLIPAPRGTGLVAAPASKKLLSMAGLEDCYTSSRGHTRTMGNFIKATFFAISKSYGYLSPELWKETVFQPPPFQEHTDFLKIEKKAADSGPSY